MRAIHVQAGRSKIDIGNLSLLAAKALTVPITDILSCLYPCTNITILKKKADEYKYIIETLIYWKYISIRYISALKGPTSDSKIYIFQSKVNKMLIWLQCNKLHAAHWNVTHYTLLTKLHFISGDSLCWPCC
jgi:hypothetical protein